MTHEELAEWIAHPVWSPRIKRHGVPTEDALRFVDTYTQSVVSTTLRIVAEQVQDERDRVDLLRTASQVESTLDDACCPLCEEAVCDSGCPLAPVRTQQEPKEPATDAELHERRAHPDWEYHTTEGPRKQWDDVDRPPLGEDGNPDPSWERNVDAGRDGWERWDYTEESYWRRRKR